MTSRYLPPGPFTEALQRRVDGYFAASHRSPRAPVAMWLKTAFILAWFVASWALLVFVASTWWQAALGVASLALAMAGIGFNVQHDGGHRASSDRPVVNRALARTLDLLGASSYVWHWKHNVHHHANTNVEGLDVDIDIQPFVRLAPGQRWRPWHRYQHLYTWPLYGLLLVKWHFVDDFKDVLTGRIGAQPFPRPRGADLAAFVLGKVLFVGWAFVIPLMVHPWWVVLLGYLAVSGLVSLALALTFQSAHCVVGAEFTTPGAPTEEWTAHQVRTSLDFAPGHAGWTWFLGGLNYQLEHHLFPRVCHVHYPALAPLVREVCEAHGVPYQVKPSVRAALASHARWLWDMGRPPLPAAA